MKPTPAVAAALRSIAAGFSQLAAAAEAEPHSAGWIDANSSPRGARWFWRAARGREARGEPGVSIAGRRCLMTRAALDEELARASAKRPAATSPAPQGVREELMAELRLVRGGGSRDG